MGGLLTLPDVVDARVALVLARARLAGRWGKERNGGGEEGGLRQGACLL